MSGRVKTSAIFKRIDVAGKKNRPFSPPGGRSIHSATRCTNVYLYLHFLTTQITICTNLFCYFTRCSYPIVKLQGKIAINYFQKWAMIFATKPVKLCCQFLQPKLLSLKMKKVYQKIVYRRAVTEANASRINTIPSIINALQP